MKRNEKEHKNKKCKNNIDEWLCKNNKRGQKSFSVLYPANPPKSHPLPSSVVDVMMTSIWIRKPVCTRGAAKMSQKCIFIWAISCIQEVKF